MLTRTILGGLSLLGLSLACAAGCDDSSGEISGGGSSGASGSGTGGTGGAGAAGGTVATGGTGQSGSGGAGSGGKGGAGGSAGKGGTAGTGGTPQQTNSVLQHHNHASRDGVYVDSKLTRAAVPNLHVDATFAGAIPTPSGPIYAQTLYLAGTAGKPDLVIAATEQNHVYGFNAATGTVVWDRALDAAVPRSDLDCGNIQPSVGVTGTPIIDEATRTIYLDAMTRVNAAPHHIVWALNADTGTPRSNWKVDLQNAGINANSVQFDSKPENQRGALALLGGFVFVPFGGHAGDCGLYHGWVIGISTTDATQIRAWNTRAIAGGIWAPAGIASDGTSLYFATGNTQNAVNVFAAPGNWGDGEALFKLPTSLPPLVPTTDFYAPAYWKDLDNGDTDISGTAPVLFDLAGKSYALGLGKDGKAYLVDRANMGGFSDPPVIQTVANGAIINAAATYKTPLGTYVVFRGSGSNCPAGTGGLTALKISAGSPPTLSTAWCAGPGTSHSPAVSMVDAQGNDAIVWIVGNDNKLYGLNADTGAPLFGGGAQPDTMSGVARFQTPIVVKGRIFVAATDRVYAFTLP